MPNEDFELCDEQTAFNRKFVKKYFTVKKKYERPYDILLDIKKGKLDKALECYGEYKDLVQVWVEISTEKLDEKGSVLTDVFHVVTKQIERNGNMKDKIINQLHTNSVRQIGN